MNTRADEACRRYLAGELRRYWPRAEDAVLQIAIPEALRTEPPTLPPRMTVVPLPEWAADLGVDGSLLAPEPFVTPGPQETWRQTDWWGVAFWYLNGMAERAYEQMHAPIHSYSFRLRGWDGRMWERAWVNRIALFLRRWTARRLQQEEEALFGRLPSPEILITHDVDAIRKTAAIRFKQSAFHGYNALRLASRGRMAHAFDKVGSAVRFLFSSSDYWRFDDIEKAEELAGVRSCFFVHGGNPQRHSLKQALFDPGYDVLESRLARKLQALSANGWEIGLHQSFDAWRDSRLMASEKARVEEAVLSNVTMCRQHWLRFSWRDTWRAQDAAGLETDATLGFNDRPGFRNSAALRFHPWDEAGRTGSRLASLPMLLMDSQFYDYSAPDDSQRTRIMCGWVEEVRAVRGEASVSWHPHTLSIDYGWSSGFSALLECMGASEISRAEDLSGPSEPCRPRYVRI